MVITRYNETNADHRAVALTNSIGTISPTLVGVGFSHPSGKFRVNDFTNFTHFTAEFGGVTYIYKVTSFTAVNSTVREVAYTLDYMKDWFSKNAWSDLKGAVVVKSNNSSDRSPYIVDNEFLADGTSLTTFSLVSSMGSSWDAPSRDNGGGGYGRYVVVVNYPYGSNGMPCIACGMTADQFGRFAMAMLSSEGASMAKQIKAAYYCPFWNLLPAGLRENGNIGYMKATDDGQGNINVKTEPFRPLDANGNIDASGTISCQLIYGTNSQRVKPAAPITLSNVSASDFIDLDLTTRNLYVPYYGTTDVPDRKLFSNGTVHLSLSYLLSPFDGQVSFEWDFNAQMIPMDYRDLPKLSIPSGAMAVQITNALEQYRTQQAFGLMNTLAKGATLDVGGFAGATMAVLQNSANTKNTLDSISRSGIDYAMQASGWSGFNDSRFLLNEIRPMSITYNDRCAHAGYPCNKMAVNVTPVTNKRYLIDTKYMEVNGLDWYADGVRSDISGEYIYYNK